MISTTRLSGFCKSSAQRAENSYEFSGLNQKKILGKEFDRHKTALDSDSTKSLFDFLYHNLYFVHKGDTLFFSDTCEGRPYIVNLWNEQVELSLDDRFFTDVDSVVAKKNLKFWTDRVYLKRQLVLARGDFNQALYANLTWLLLALVPLQAMILSLVYYRKKKFFIEHYVFLLELFSAIILITSLFLLLLPLFEKRNIIFACAFFTSAIFALFSFRRFYKQSWLLTLFKFILFCFLFFITTLLTLLAFAVLVAFFF